MPARERESVCVCVVFVCGKSFIVMASIHLTSYQIVLQCLRPRTAAACDRTNMVSKYFAPTLPNMY